MLLAILGALVGSALSSIMLSALYLYATEDEPGQFDLCAVQE